MLVHNKALENRVLLLCCHTRIGSWILIRGNQSKDSSPPNSEYLYVAPSGTLHRRRGRPGRDINFPITIHENPSVHSESRRIFRCTLCLYSTTVKGSMESHVRRHTGEKPFQCSECGRAFAQRGILYRHYREVHQNFKRNNIRIEEY